MKITNFYPFFFFDLSLLCSPLCFLLLQFIFVSWVLPLSTWYQSLLSSGSHCSAIRDCSLVLLSFPIAIVLSFPFLIFPMVNQSYADFSTNSANPYYLHPNENPALVLVTPPLNDKNYHVWARSMQIALISKNKEKFIDGTLIKPPVSDPLYAPWIRCNTMVLAWIQRSISESIAKSVLWIDNAAGVWRNL